MALPPVIPKQAVSRWKTKLKTILLSVTIHWAFYVLKLIGTVVDSGIVAYIGAKHSKRGA